MRNRLGLVLAIGFLFGRVAFGATQLITNGGFELGTNGWQFSGNLTTVPVVTNPGLAHNGVNYLSLGNAGGPVTEGVFQSVVIPTNTLLAQFTYFWGGATGTDPVGADQFAAAVVDGQGTHFMGQQNSALSGYQQAVFNLTNFAGETVQIGFFVQAPNAGIGVQTFFAVDDVSLLAFSSNDIPVNDNFANATILTTTTNISVLATNILATKEPGEPKHAGVTGGHSLWWQWTAPSNGAVVINTDNSTFNTVLAVYTGTSVSNLTLIAANDDESTAQGQLTSQVRFLVMAGTQYKIAVDGKGGATGVVQLNLNFSPDTKPPTVSITSPKNGAKLTVPSVFIQGKATDNLGVALVQYRLENAAGTTDYQNADGTNTWSATVNNLIPGPNTIRVKATDISGNESAGVTTTVSFVVTSPITVTTTGGGTVTPNLNGQVLDVGNTFTMTAKPSAGQVFSNWTGSVTATTAALTFVMQTNMMLTANFVPNPFGPTVGAYQGLFYDTNGPEHQSSGFTSLTVASAGSFSAKVTLGGKAYSLSGQFSAGGFASNNIVRKGLTPVSAQLNLDMTGGGITGVLSDGTFIAELNAFRTTTSPGANAGRYTLVIPGAETGSGRPGGDSYGTLVVGPTGAIAVSGVLSDGTKFAQKANLLTTGQWAFYVPLYNGNGSILSWLTFDTGAISGTADWFKLSAAGGKFYPAGFTNATTAAGSSYVFTAGVPVLNLAPGQMWLQNGNLTESFTNQITMDSASKITSTNATVKVTVTTSTGLFKGTVVNPADGKSISFNGVLLQKQNIGAGFFTGFNQTGRVYIQP
jgi:hypothetical protein